MTPRTAILGASDMAARMREVDWDATSLGAFDTWPQTLRSALGICVESAFPIAIYWGPDLTLLYNDAWSSIPGEKHPWALGRPAIEVWPEIWDAIGPLFDRVFSTGTATYLQDSLLLMHRHGYTEECYFNYTFTPIRGEDGAVHGVFNAVLETTYRVIAERRSAVLRETAQALSGLRAPADIVARSVDALTASGLDATFACIYMFDRSARAATLAATAGLADPGPARPALDDDTRWPFASLADVTEPVVMRGLEATHGRLPGGAWNEPTHTAIAVPLRTGESARPSGCLILGASPRRAVDDAYVQFAVQAGAHVSAALTSAIAFEVERTRAEALTEIDRQKSVFFSNISHEFRTPLALMIGPTEDALASPGRALAGEALEGVYRNELRLLKLVNALLDFARLEAGRMVATYERTDLARCTVELASAFRSAFDRAGLSFSVVCDPIVAEVFVDRRLWETVVLNLLSNALKFTFDGGVSVRLTETADAAVLTVHDTGIGIAAADLPHVFERFRRVEGVRARTHEGSGIGLALVHDLVGLHGGTCTLDSVPGRGTTVTVTLPTGRAHLAPERIRTDGAAAASVGPNPYVLEALSWFEDEAPVALAMPVDEPAQPLVRDRRSPSPAHVLVVDDNADMRQYLGRLLSRHWSVETAIDGAAALDAVERRRPDLVLSDVMMPRLDGFALLQALRHRARTADLPVILLSARAGEEALVEGVHAGADDYLVKPFSARELVARVNAQLRLAEAARERADLLAREQEAREAAEIQRRQLRAIFDQAPTLIAVFRGADHVIELANHLICRAWGRRQQDVLGRPFFDAMPEARDQAWRALLDGVYASGEPYIGREVAAEFDRHGDGRLETRYFDFVWAPLREGGEVSGIIVIATDVTGQVMARRESSALRDAAEAANRAKDEFLAVLGHELRNPLSPITTALELLRLRGQVSREISVIERQVAHLTRLVNDLLDVSRITRGKVDLYRRPVDLAEILSRAIEMASPLLEQRQQHLDLEVPSGLVVDADLDRLAQVLGNVLTNASKYSDPETRIGVTARRERDAIEIGVTDCGVGIPADLLDRVFEPFAQQPQTSDRSHGGLGLGLAIARNLVERHGGAIRAESTGPGAGSRFVITLPAAALPPVPEAEAASPPPPAALSRGRVLVVDDNRDATDMLSLALTQSGFDVRVAHDGPDALERARAFQPQVALLDIGLPVMDGYELGARLRSELPAVALVAVTGYGQDLDRQRSASAGFMAHLLKPVNLDTLDEILQEAVRG